MNFRRVLPAALSALLAAAALAGCARPGGDLVPGVYRAVLTVPGGELPFGLAIAARGGRTSVFLLNGEESVAIGEARHDGARIVLDMPGYANRIEMVAERGGYRGEAVMVRPGGTAVHLPFRAVRGERYRFAPTEMKSPPQLAGRWAVTERDSQGRQTPAIAELRQIGSRVFGTILAPAGDHRFLEGDVRGDELFLSRFDGGEARLYRARLNADGSLAGRAWSGSWSVDDIAGHRDEAATLDDPASAAPLPASLRFSFAGLDGRTVSFDDPRFRGKVVIVTIGGSWCPNSHDEAAFLAPLYRERHGEGLEIVSLQFEYFADFRSAVAVNRRFAARFGIDWPVLIAGTASLDEAERALPTLGRVYAFPTTVVIDRRGSVREVHSGFSGPATGQHYEAFRAQFTDLVRQLLAERA